MDLIFINKTDSRNLINGFILVDFEKNTTPFKTPILQLGRPFIFFHNYNKQKAVFKNKRSPLNNIICFGQINGAFDYFVNQESTAITIRLQPTTYYKIFKKNISDFTNKFTSLEDIDKDLYNSFLAVYNKYGDFKEGFVSEIIKIIDSLDVTENQDTKYIDKAVDYIIEKEGLLNVSDLLDLLPFGNKSLQVKFKKIVGLTPLKYIKLVRFSRFIKKYESKEIDDFKELLELYNYYDQSHIIKDFKFYMHQTPNAFFKEEYPFIKKYILK